MLRGLSIFAFWLGLLLPGNALARQPCTAANAKRVAIDTLKADYAPWLGKCVRVRGIAFEGRVFVDRRALLEPLHYDDSPGSIVFLSRRSRLGRRPVTVEAVGQVQSCAFVNDVFSAEAASHPAAIVWASGYCHTSMETHLADTEIRILSERPIARLTEAEVAVAQRRLVAVPEDEPPLTRHVAAAQALRAALANDDAQAFRRARHPEVEYELANLGSVSRPEWLDDAVRDAARDFRKARSRRQAAQSASRQFRVFLDRESADEHGSGRASAPDRILACWCTVNDCAGRWPVTEFDADNAPGRPYFCVQTDDYVLGPGKGSVPAADIPIERQGFAEPRRRNSL
jgi:hypothetical protein